MQYYLEDCLQEGTHFMVGKNKYKNQSEYKRAYRGKLIVSIRKDG